MGLPLCKLRFVLLICLRRVLRLCLACQLPAQQGHSPCGAAGSQGHVAALSDVKAVVPITNLGSKKQRASNEGDANGSFIVPAGLFAVS